MGYFAPFIVLQKRTIKVIISILFSKRERKWAFSALAREVVGW